MKIVIHEGDSGKDIKLHFPTSLIFNPFSALIAHSVLHQNHGSEHVEKDFEELPEDVVEEENSEELPEVPEGVNIRRRDLIRFCNEVNRMKRIHKNMPLVDVLDSGGDSVQIFL